MRRHLSLADTLLIPLFRLYADDQCEENGVSMFFKVSCQMQRCAGTWLTCLSKKDGRHATSPRPHRLRWILLPVGRKWDHKLLLVSVFSTSMFCWR